MFDYGSFTKYSLDHLNVLPSSNWSLDTLVMASTSTGVIDVQPQLYSNKPPAGSNLLQHRVDDNGEEIILEGICAQKRLRSDITSCYHVSTVTLPLSCLLGKMCGAKAVDVWSLYLTSTGIFFVDFNAACVCCSKSQVHIALADINEIQEVSYVYMAGPWYCKYGTKIDSTTIRLELKPNKAKEFFPLHYRCLSSCSDDIPIVIDFNYCENAMEFVEAVKQQMAAMGL